MDILSLLLMKAQTSGGASPGDTDADAVKVIIADAFEDYTTTIEESDMGVITVIATEGV